MLVFGSLLLLSPSLWAYQSDAGLVNSINHSYIFNNYLKNDDITVHSKDGVVTLTGTVADENHKFLAQNTAENLPEVRSVDNELQVKQGLPPIYSDAWIGLKVKAALLFHQNVSAVRTHVDVKDGIVTLSGYADSEAQRELTSAYARDIDGVKGVDNSMEIRKMESNPGPTNNNAIDDASITAQVKLTLFVHQSTSAIHTHVKTENGTVTLTGTAKNDAEKSLVTKLVSDIDGVRNVVNDMDVHP